MLSERLGEQGGKRIVQGSGQVSIAIGDLEFCTKGFKLFKG